MITYKHAKSKDIPSIINFLKNHWDSNHIILKRPDIFSHYYLSEKKIPNYFLAFNSENEVIGTLGYITNKMFSKKVKGNGAWLSMWCVAHGLKEPVGFSLLKTLEEKLSVDFIATFGAGLHTLPYYNKLGYVTGAAEHWKCDLEKCNKFDNKWLVTDRSLSGNTIKNSTGKNEEYLQNKFIKTNFYKYLTFNISKNKDIVTNIVARVIDYPQENTKILRIVDFSGEINGISELAIYLAKQENYKFINYVDILLGSVRNSVSLSPIFHKCSSSNYLPLYFEPFIAEYAKKYFVYKSNNPEFRNNLIVTGDCDQDRPSM